jgi:hypothetical protein
MRSKLTIALISVAAIVLGGCTTPAAAPSAPSATQVAVATLAASSAPAASPTAGPIDPCSLLTTDEASTAIGKKLSAGVSTTADPLRVCTFKSGQTEVKLFVAPPAPDAATAQAFWDSERSQVPADIPVKDVSGFDRAAFGSGSLGSVSLGALFVIHGTTFFDLYCGYPACTEAASVTAAHLIVGRLP